LTHPGEAHEEPIAVCCSLSADERAWNAAVLIHINETRSLAGLPELEADPLLDQAAIAWALHWSLHWDPVSESGYPGRTYSPSEVAEACGTSAQLLMATDAQDEPTLNDGLIDPHFPADYWSTDDNLQNHFLNPDFTRIGIGIHQGLLVGILAQ
jgi:hypothetical protein